MKTSSKILLTLTAGILAAVMFAAHPFLAVLGFALVLNVWLSPRELANEPRLGTLTLILALLTRKCIAAFKAKVPPLGFISTDLGRQAGGGDFASPVKFGQEVISQLAIAPTVADHIPGEDLETGAQAITDLGSDLYVKIDRAKKALIKIPAATTASYVLDGLLDQVIMEAGMALGRAVMTDVFTSLVTPANFTLNFTETAANSDFDTLRTQRVTLNTYGALTPRFGIAGSTVISNISDDPSVASGDYHNQRVGADPYLSLVGIQGLTEFQEFPGFSADNAVIGTFTAVAATNVITTSAAHGLNIGDRVRVSSATTLPAGLSAATNYFVISVPSTTTLTLSATSGGAVVDITDTGTGVHTMTSHGQLNAFYFERRAIHFVSRQLIDNLELARRLGIPQVIAQHTEVDQETGLAFTVFTWMKQGTQDIYMAFTVAYGCKGGRGLAAAAGVDPGSIAAGDGMDYAGVRQIEA